MANNCRIRFLIAPLLFLCLTTAARAADIDRQDPVVMVQQATESLLQLARDARSYAPEEKSRYYREVSGVLHPVIDTEYFARGVMATYASARVYKSLGTDAEREAFKGRVSRFADTMERVLIETYADVLLTFEGERIDVVLVPGDDISTGKARVQQTIYTKEGNAYVVQYSAYRNKAGEWQIYNVVVEGVNMGATYRSQFADAVERNGGNVDYVVDNWQSLMGQAARSKPGSEASQQDSAGQGG